MLEVGKSDWECSRRTGKEADVWSEWKRCRRETMVLVEAKGQRRGRVGKGRVGKCLFGRCLPGVGEDGWFLGHTASSKPT